MRPAWVRPRLAPSPTTLTRSSAPLIAHRVVGLVADVGVGSRAGPSHRCRCRRGRAARPAPCRMALISSAGASASAVDVQQRLDLRRQRDRLQRCARRRRRPWRSASCRSRPRTSAAGRTSARARPRTCAGSGSGSRKMWRWSKAASSRICFDSSMPLPNTSPDMSPHADDGEGLGLDVLAQFAEVALHRLPGAAGGDAHGLVVVAGRAAGGEGVAQPEAVVLGHAVGDVGEGGRALVGGDHQIGIVAVVDDDVRRAGSPCRRRRGCR